MARPKKEGLSKAVNPGVKRGNPDFVSSSFYVPKKINLRFDRAILTLKASGYDIDRSDILSTLMDLFAETVDAAEKQGGEVDLESVLAAGSERILDETAAVSGMVSQMRESVSALKDVEKETRAELESQRVKLEELQERISKAD